MNNNPNNNQKASEGISIVDILTMPISQATKLLLNIGAKTIVNIKQSTSEVFSTLNDEAYEKVCRSVLTMDECVNWLQVQRVSYPDAGYFFICSEENTNPRNENDKYSITLSLLDINKKPIYVNKPKSTGFFNFGNISSNSDIVAIVIPAKTIDYKLVNALNGTSSVLVKL